MSVYEIDRVFNSADNLIYDARESLRSFIGTVPKFSFFERLPIISEVDIKTGNQLIKVRFPDADPAVRRLAYRTVCDIRNGLDQAVYAATVCFEGKVNGRKTYFPFAGSPEEFEIQLHNKRKGTASDLTSRIAPAIRHFEPWWTGPNHSGGNDTLRFIGKISGPNKHQVQLSTTPHITGSWFNNARMTNLIELKMPPERVAGTNDFTLVTLAAGGTFECNGGMSFTICLSQGHPRLPQEATSALSEMYDIAQKIVAALKSVCVQELT